LVFCTNYESLPPGRYRDAITIKTHQACPT